MRDRSRASWQYRQVILEDHGAAKVIFRLTEQLIFQSEREPGNPFYQIYILDFETGDTHAFRREQAKRPAHFSSPGPAASSSPRLTKTGAPKNKKRNWISVPAASRAVTRGITTRVRDLLRERDGSDLKNLTHSPGYDAEGSFSPDGKQIVFCSLRAAFPLEQLSSDCGSVRAGSFLFRRHLPDQYRRFERPSPNDRAGLRGGPFLPRWAADCLAPFRGERGDRRRLDDETDGPTKGG